MIVIPGRKPNATPVAKHFHSTKPVSEQFALFPHATLRPGMRPMLRLSFGALTPKEDRSIPELFNLIVRGPLNSRWIFPDTNFITNTIQPQFWMIGQGRRIAFTAMTIAELTGWFAHPMHNPYLQTWLPRAVRKCQAEPITEGGCYRVAAVLGAVGNDLMPFSLAIADRERFRRFGYDYYVNLLSLRKKLGIVVQRQLRERLGRDPTEQELKQELHNNYHPRIASIALKGWKDQGKPNYLADEELVVTAVLTAILSGTETLILTWDTDLFDQFAKLMELLLADYACFRFSEVRFANPEGCPMFRMDITTDSDGEFGFCGDAVEHVVIPYSEWEQLPPYDYTPVHTYCVLLGNNCHDPKISTAAFCLETEMACMLETKGETGGKNTAHFPGRNLVIGTRRAPGQLGTLFVLGQEQYLTYEGVEVSWFDLQRALQSDPLIIRKYSLP